jgi:hypothetical protein
VSLATATDFLNHFKVEMAVNVAVFHAEDADIHADEIVGRIVKSRGLTLRDLGGRLITTSQVPALASSEWLESAIRFVRVFEPELMILDDPERHGRSGSRRSGLERRTHSPQAIENSPVQKCSERQLSTLARNSRFAK